MQHTTIGAYREHRNTKCVHCGHIGFSSEYPDEPAQHPGVCCHCRAAGRTMPEPPEPAAPRFDRAEHCRQIGTLGGQRTAQTYGRRYMAEIGKIGFQVYAERHHDGNRAAALGSIRAFRDPDARVRQPGPFRQMKQHAA